MSEDRGTNAARLARHRDTFRTVHAGISAARRQDGEASQPALAEALGLLMRALIDADRIAQAKPLTYADFGTNPRRHHTDVRPFTLKDAKEYARYVARDLRKAWELLDPLDPPR